jgi:hypothetical protein
MGSILNLQCRKKKKRKKPLLPVPKQDGAHYFSLYVPVCKLRLKNLLHVPKLDFGDDSN